MKKRITALALAFVMVLGTVAAAAGAEKVISVTPMDMSINGQTVVPTKSDGTPAEVFAYDGATYVPLRYLSELLGIEVQWDKDHPNTATLMNVPGFTAPTVTATFTPGTYEGTARGYNGDVTMKVTVSDSAILSVEAGKHQESPGVSDPAFAKLPALIVEKQTVALDTVSGCTVASRAILEATKQALLAAGASEAAITKAPTEDAPVDLTAETYTADVVIIGADEKRQKNQTMTDSELAKVEELLELEPKNEWMKSWQDQVSADLKAYKAAGSKCLYDSTALHALQTYVGGDYVGDAELIDTFAKGASESVTYMEDLGAVWHDDVTAAIGATWQRSHMPTTDVWCGKGSSFVLPQATAAQKQGAQVLFEHVAKEILTDNGRVVGVKGETTQGAPFTVNANKSVIIATGGFGANVEMRQKYNTMWPDLGENVRTTNVVTARGDGIVMAEAVGANLVGMEWIQMLTNGDIMDFSASINNMIFVNAEGERFVREDGRRDEIASAKVHHTMGGIQINTQAQVMGKDGNVIPVLFAAGEVTGGIHGSNRLGGNAIADAVTFGRIAGRSASK